MPSPPMIMGYSTCGVPGGITQEKKKKFGITIDNVIVCHIQRL